MSRRTRLIILALIALLLIAGAGDALLFGGFPVPQPPAGTIWTLRQYISGGADVSLPAGRSATLRTQTLGHKISGTSGCNSYFGSYSSYFPGRLGISGLGQTVMYCLPASLDEFEARYLGDLQKVASYRLDGADLVLSGDGGRLMMRFAPASLP